MSDFLSFHLSDEFVSKYAEIQPDWGFGIGGGNSLSELTFITKYSRLKSDGTKEKWHEVCRRCIEGMYSILKDHCSHQRTPWNEFKAQKAAQDAFDRMFNFKWTPPGRGMWAMGTEFVHLSQSNSSLNNCFSGDTQFITREYGLTSFKEVVGEEVSVWSYDGWTSAVVQHFGQQQLNKIIFKPFNSSTKTIRRVVYATPDHRWRDHDGNWTTSLKSGMVIEAGNSIAPPDYGDAYWDGILHGIIFGDGTKHPHIYSNGDLRFQLHACDDRIEQMMLHPEMKSRINTRFEQSGDYHFSIRTTTNLKEFPLTNDGSYLRGFLEGWILADAYVSPNGIETYILASSKPEALPWLMDNAILGGFSVTGANLDPVTETNFGKRKYPSVRISLQRGSIPWKVESIEPHDVGDVYCALVPLTSQFTLAGGISTGNCAFLTTEKLSTHSAYEATMPFSRLMEMSMNGVGVGYDTRGAGKLTIWEPAGEPVSWIVPDSREGWAESISKLLETYFFKNRQPIEFDYTAIRPAGSELKSFGGTASGPEPLMWVHESIAKQFSGRHGEKITSRDIVDIMNKIAKAVVAGGARRSALISLGFSDDDDYVNIKNWELPENAERTGPDGWAWTSNNSVMVREGDDLSHLIDKIAINGEPGVIWLDVMRKYGRLADNPNNKDYRVSGTNPCVTSDTWTLTAAGPRQVSDLIGVPHTQIVDGKPYSATGFWHSGDKEVFDVTFSDGRSLRLTGNHKLQIEDDSWIEVDNLEVGDKVKLNRHNDFSWIGPGSFEDGYILGHLIGDGTFDPSGKPFLAVWQQDSGSDVVADYLFDIVSFMGHRSDFNGWFDSANQRRLGTSALRDFASKYGVVRGNKTITKEMESDSSDFSSGVLSGLFDTDGSVQGTTAKGISVRCSNTDLSLLEAAQRMLLRLGINSSIYFRRDEHEQLLPDGRGGMAKYVCKPQWELVIARENLQVFSDRVGFKNPVKAQKLEDALTSYKRNLYRDKFVSVVVSIQPAGIESVYDVTVEDVHAFDANGLMAHNCAEISLESSEFCNLAELYPIRHESFDDFKKSIKHAYMYTKAVTLMPSTWAETNEVITRNRRIGVSMTGIVEFIESRSWADMKHWMDEGYQYITAVDNKYSEWLGVRNSIKLTTVKPAGTTSLIAGTTSGVHWPTTTGWFIRRIRFHKNDPLVEIIAEAGYHVEPDVNDPRFTVVASFPTRGIDIRSEREVSIWEKAHLAAMAQRYWADNMVSVTVSFTEQEKQEIEPLLRSLQGQLKSISFLPIHDGGTTYAQAPYEPITESEARKMMEGIKPLDIAKLYATADADGEKFCTTDVCEIKF